MPGSGVVMPSHDGCLGITTFGRFAQCVNVNVVGCGAGQGEAALALTFSGECSPGLQAGEDFVAAGDFAE